MSHPLPNTTSRPAAPEVMETLRIEDDPPVPPRPYEYQPLPTLTSIRLLKVAPESEGDGTLRVSLNMVDLAEGPVFCALSYTWGNPHANGVDFTAHFDAVNSEYAVSEKRAVLCDGKVLKIQRNLLDVLSEFLDAFGGNQQGELHSRRTEPTKDTPCVLAQGELGIWVDAICINQEDMEERAQQVKIMDKIYSKAARTIVWLGRADEYTPAAAETITRVAAYPKEPFARSDVNPFKRQEPELYAKNNLEYTSWLDWCSLAALLKRQWFSRLWIVQETILSRELVLLCGKHCISWSDLVKATRNIEARCGVLGWSPSTMFLRFDEVAVPLEHNVVRLADWRDHHHNEGSSDASRFTLENLIYDTWIFNSGDPRDKIYGVLGLVGPEVRAAWTIDYESATEEVYADTTRRIIEQSQSLKILSCVQDASKRIIAAYPSWVPDYSLPYVNMMGNHGSFQAAGREHQVPQILPSPSASGLSGHWSRLCLRGHVFDTIVETGNERTAYVNSAMLLEPSWFELALLLKTPYPSTGQKRTEVLWRTLCADQDASSTTSPAPASFGALFKELICAMVVVRAEGEEEASREPNPPRDCATSFAQAMQKAKEIWADVGWDHLMVDEIREKTNSRPRLLWRPEFGWLVHTLIKMQALALTEAGGSVADTPSWEELEHFHEKPTYVMRVKDGQSRTLVQPKDPAFSNSFRRRYGKRKLFYTEKGYLGLGPASTKVGDVVCIFPGAAGPFVCREDPGGGVKLEEDADEADGAETKKLRLIGESYVHGIMYGEASDSFVFDDIELV